MLLITKYMTIHSHFDVVIEPSVDGILQSFLVDLKCFPEVLSSKHDQYAIYIKAFLIYAYYNNI